MEQTTEKKILLDCRNVSLGYEGKAIWEGLTFQVRSGDYLCIVGENGSGKSTLLKSLLGLLKPLSGEIVHADTLRGGSIGYLPQQTRAQKDFPATVTEVVRSGFLSGKRGRFFYTPQEKSTALMNMGKLGVLELKDRCYRELSGGQQQRVAIARALATKPAIILADEPTGNLNSEAADEVMELLKKCVRDFDRTVIMITHNEALIGDCDRILHIRDGVLTEEKHNEK